MTFTGASCGLNEFWTLLLRPCQVSNEYLQLQLQPFHNPNKGMRRDEC